MLDGAGAGQSWASTAHAHSVERAVLGIACETLQHPFCHPHAPEQELAAVIHSPEQILVCEGYCLKSACCLMEIDHRELWHFWNSKFQTLAVFSRWEGLPPGPLVCLDGDRDAKPRCSGRMWYRDRGLCKSHTQP